MEVSGLIVQLLNGLAGTSSLFMVAAGLSLIFGVTRIINFAHGSLYMLGIYIAYSLTSWLGGTALGFWGGLLAAGLLVAVLGVLIEVFLLRRIYRAPELFQLLATFALVLIASDAAHWLWGPEDLLGMQAPGLEGAIPVLGRMFPTYNIFLMIIGPLVLLLLWWLLNRTRWGTFVRAATQDKEMLGALGVNQAWLFTSVFALGSFLAGLGGALELPNEPASLGLDMRIIGDAFAVVVVGGMGSITGAFLAALLITEMKAICIWLGTVQLAGLQIEFSQLTMVVEFLVMALVLVFRPWGLLGREQAASRNSAPIEAPIRPAGRLLQVAACLALLLLAGVPLLEDQFPYLMILTQDALIAVLFATSLHFIAGPAGMHTFGHAAYFGLGAYAAALLMQKAGLPLIATLFIAPLFAAFGALVYGWFCVRLSGIYLAMLTLAFAQITWSVVFQWDSFTGGSNGLIGIWPPEWLSSPQAYYYFTLIIVAGSVLVLRRLLFSPFGYAMRAGRDSVLRSDAIGINVKQTQWLAFVIAGLFAGLAGVLYVYSKGSVSPEELHISKSIDGLVMVLLGGVQSLLGPIVGAFSYTVLHDYVVGITDYWKALFGLVILVLVLLFPQGIAGFFARLCGRFQARQAMTPKGQP